jgi:hypothetical protein
MQGFGLSFGDTHGSGDVNLIHAIRRLLWSRDYIDALAKYHLAANMAAEREALSRLRWYGVYW